MRFVSEGKPKYTLDGLELDTFYKQCKEAGNNGFKASEIEELAKGVVFDGNDVGKQEAGEVWLLAMSNLIGIFTPTGYCQMVEFGNRCRYKLYLSEKTIEGDDYHVSFDFLIFENKPLSITMMGIDTEVKKKDGTKEKDGATFVGPEIMSDDLFKLCNFLHKVNAKKICYTIASDMDFPSVLNQWLKEERISSNEMAKFLGGEIEEIYNVLVELRKEGFELSPEQEDIINKCSKIKEFKANKAAREEKQKLTREKIASENERKYEWWANPENPSNIHAVELTEKVAQAQSQISKLEKLRNIGIKLTAQQEHLLEGNKLFIKTAISEDKDITQNMEQQVAEWYQDEYGNSGLKR